MCHIPDPSKCIRMSILYIFSYTSPYGRHSSQFLSPCFFYCYGPLQDTGLIDRLCEADLKDRDIEVSRNPTYRDLDICKLSRASVASS